MELRFALVSVVCLGESGVLDHKQSWVESKREVTEECWKGFSNGCCALGDHWGLWVTVFLFFFFPLWQQQQKKNKSWLLSSNNNSTKKKKKLSSLCVGEGLLGEYWAFPMPNTMDMAFVTNRQANCRIAFAHVGCNFTKSTLLVSHLGMELLVCKYIPPLNPPLLLLPPPPWGNTTQRHRHYENILLSLLMHSCGSARIWPTAAAICSTLLKEDRRHPHHSPLSTNANIHTHIYKHRMQ